MGANLVDRRAGGRVRHHAADDPALRGARADRLPRATASQRVYAERDRVRLQLILRGKRLGFTLEEIAHIIDLYDDPPGEAGQLEFLLADI